MQPSESDEWLDLVDEHDQVIGKKTRSQVYAEGLTNFRVINVFLINSKGELWIPRRTANKRICPLALDMSVGGHVSSGESYEETLIRETKEEIDIDLQSVPFRELGHLTPHEHGMSAFQKVYEISYEEVPGYNRDDFIEYFWLTPQAFFARLAAGDRSKDDLPKLIKIFYGQS